MVAMQLYICEDDRKKINKNPGPIGPELSCHLKDDTSLFKPTMIIDKSKLGDQWPFANYAYIPDFGRYYFIDDIEALTGNRVAFHMTIDPLYTYADSLMGKSFLIARSETNGSAFFIDAEKALQSTKTVEYDILGNVRQDTTGNKYVLTVAGGF